MNNRTPAEDVSCFRHVNSSDIPAGFDKAYIGAIPGTCFDHSLTEAECKAKGGAVGINSMASRCTEVTESLKNLSAGNLTQSDLEEKAMDIARAAAGMKAPEDAQWDVIKSTPGSDGSLDVRLRFTFTSKNYGSVDCPYEVIVSARTASLSSGKCK